jgi:hypothetical protein
MKAIRITITKDDDGRMVIRHRNGDYTLDGDTREAIAALVDDNEWVDF